MHCNKNVVYYNKLCECGLSFKVSSYPVLTPHLLVMMGGDKMHETRQSEVNDSGIRRYHQAPSDLTTC